MKFQKALLVFVIIISTIFTVYSQDWPIYKGNIYFTGNNDEIVVKNGNLKWLYQASERIYNPVVSDGRIYFIDQKAFLYCLDEEYGTLLWKIDIRNISSHFKRLSRAAGKIKYPLIKGNILFLSDPVAIYALDKRTGRVLWARTGFRTEKTPQQGLSTRRSVTVVDGIYADPVIDNGVIYYGTRNMFMARLLSNGHEKWQNRDIKSYSGFPTFYDDYIFSQSMDYSTGIYKIYCLKSQTGAKIWEQTIQKPIKIFPPVIYKQKVYIPSTSKMYCLDLKTGRVLWNKDYEKYITSNPSFTDRAILFSVNNADIAVINPENGDLIETVKIAPKSSPHYVTIRDQVYVAYNGEGGVNRAYGHVKAVNFVDKSQIWTFRTPFPGAVSQPAASRGILFLPAGNYMYAIGATSYPRNVQGGSANSSQQKPIEKPADPSHQNPLPEKKKEKLREVDIQVVDENGNNIPAYVEVKKYDKNGREIYRDRQAVKNGKIKIPENGNVEVTASSQGYIPKKVIYKPEDNSKKVTLDKIEKGKSIIIPDINFQFGKAYLLPQSLNILDDLIRTMKQNPTMQVEVRGFTDNVGNDSYNQKLSEKRADSVREYMIKNGISPERIRAVGYGEKNPVADNNTKEGRAKNRRTEFFIIRK